MADGMKGKSRDIGEKKRKNNELKIYEKLLTATVMQTSGINESMLKSNLFIYLFIFLGRKRH